jgi:hypothetical protein
LRNVVPARLSRSSQPTTRAQPANVSGSRPAFF